MCDELVELIAGKLAKLDGFELDTLWGHAQDTYRRQARGVLEAGRAAFSSMGEA